MALTITHAFSSSKSDSPDATLIQPSNWNDEHVVSGDIDMVTGAVLVSALPASPVAGTRAFVTDSTTATFGAIVSGSGSNAMPVVFNGTNWIVG